MRPSLDSLSLVVPGWNLRPPGESASPRVWSTPAGDGVGLFFFEVPPDLPAGPGCACTLRKFYEDGLAGSPGKLVELAIAGISGCRAIRLICKFPQEPSGMVYVGSVTLPFRGFSFVAKVQCEERGMTGAKEALLLSRRLARGSSLEQAMGPGWNPDDPQLDRSFPDHPVARCRRALDEVLRHARLDAATTRSTPFPLPATPCRH